MPDAIVLTDSAGYKTPQGDTLYAAKGDKVSLPEDEYNRLLAAGAVAPASSDEGKEAAASGEAAGDPVPGAADEAELKKLKLDELRERATAAGVLDAESLGKQALVDAIRATGALTNL